MNRNPQFGIFNNGWEGGRSLNYNNYAHTWSRYTQNRLISDGSHTYWKPGRGMEAFNMDSDHRTKWPEPVPFTDPERFTESKSSKQKTKPSSPDLETPLVYYIVAGNIRNQPWVFYESESTCNLTVDVVKKEKEATRFISREKAIKVRKHLNSTYFDYLWIVIRVDQEGFHKV